MKITGRDYIDTIDMKITGTDYTDTINSHENNRKRLHRYNKQA